MQTQTEKTLQKRGPKPKPENEKGKTIAAHVEADLANRIEEVRYTRERKASFIIGEAIKIGLDAVEQKFPATRPLPKNYKAGDNLPK